MNVSLMGLDSRTEQSLLLVLKHRTDDAVRVVNEDDADVVILDLDHGMQEAVERFRSLQGRKPSIHAIGLSSKGDQTCDGMSVLRKPLSAGRLLDALQQVTGKDLQLPGVKTASLATSLGARTVGNKRDSQPRSLAESDRQFDPHDYLLGNIFVAESEATQKGKVAVIKFYGDRVICVDGKSQTVESNLTSAQIRAFSIVSSHQKDDIEADESVEMRTLSVEFISREKASNSLFDITNREPRESFMWKLGVMTSRGRLPRGTTMDERVYLRRWPNMTRLPYTENSLRIIAYWVGRALSLREITEVLGVSEEEAINVYTGIYAVGLAGNNRTTNESAPVEKAVFERKERGILSSILKRLQQRKPPVAERVFA